MRPADWLRICGRHRRALRRFRRIPHPARDRHHGLHRRSALVPHPRKREAHGAHRLAASHDELVYRCEAQPLPELALCAERRVVRCDDCVRRHRHCRNARPQAANHELECLYQRELPAARLHSQRSHRTRRRGWSNPGADAALAEAPLPRLPHARRPRRRAQAHPGTEPAPLPSA